MTKLMKDFFSLIRELREVSNDEPAIIRRIKNSDLPLEEIQLYFNQMERALEGKESIFPGTFKIMDVSFGYIENGQAHISVRWEFYEKLKKILSEIINKKKSPETTFKTNLTEKQKRDLYDELVRAGFLAKETEFSIFRDVFSGVPFSELPGKLQWIGAKNLAVYFIDKMYEENIIEGSQYLWKIGEYCFIGIKNMKQAKHKYIEFGVPKKASQIDSIIKKVTEDYR